MYKDRELFFQDSKIYYTDSDFGGEVQVMMDWEAPLMSASAAYVCQNGGDILEIGFGMGISAGYIQEHSITSHTIIENHPQIIEKANTWAQGKTNVNIVTGSWFDIRSELNTYDGIFYDTFGDDDTDNFTTVLPILMKSGGKATWWNNFTNSDDVFFIDGTTYESISINPVDNMYFNSNTYYLPKKQF